MITIVDKPKDNVILLPRTIDFYQNELTRMLETERYQQAIELLRFLRQCDSGELRTDEEWQSLLDWLENMNADIELTHLEVKQEEDEEEELTETDLFRQHLKSKTESNRDYVTSLLDTLQNSPYLEKQLLALGQLTYIEHPDITESLKQWLEKSMLFPLIQFKVLQALKRREFKGIVMIIKLGEVLELEVEQIPLSVDQYPIKVKWILSRLLQVCEVNDPSLGLIAEQTWEQFIEYIYGTLPYTKLLEFEETQLNVWAAALHGVIAESMTDMSKETEVRELYGISSDFKLQLKQAYLMIENFMQSIPSTL
mgnify:FL=1